MSSFFGDSFGDSDFSFGSDEDGSISDSNDLFASATYSGFSRPIHAGARAKTANAAQQSKGKQRARTSPDATQQSSDGTLCARPC